MTPQGSELLVRQHPILREGYAACLDLAVRLHEPFVFQAFFANVNSFPPANKTLH